MNLLDIEHEWEHIDVLKAESRTESYLEKNPNGKIPALRLESGEFLWESNAILNYLANGTEYLPHDVLKRARVLQWQFFEQYSHEPYIAVARFIVRYLCSPEDQMKRLESTRKPGYTALKVMEQQLEKTPYIASDQYTIADISLYAYTHVAEEGGFDLARFPAIRSWLSRVASHPKHIPMLDGDRTNQS